MKKLGKYSFSVLTVILTFIIGAYYTLGVCLFNKNEVTPNVRAVSLATEKIDYQAVLNEFEDSELVQDGTLTTFTGYQTLKAEIFEEIDNVSVEDVEQLSGCKVGYTFTYDNESNVVTLYAQMQNEYGEIEIDTVSGVGFINDNGEIDAVINIEGEGILLSEMRCAGAIQNCGWFSRLVKKVAKAVAVAAVVVATAAVVVATAGAVAPAVVAVGVGVAGSTAVTAGSLAVGVAAGALFYSTIGKAAIKAGTAIGEVIGEGAERIIDKVTGTVLGLLIWGVEYEVKEITKATSFDIEPRNFRFVLLNPKSGVAYMTITEFDYSTAVWGLRLGLSTYSLQSDAYCAAYDAGNGTIPRQHPKHNKDKYGKDKKGVYFDHYHAYPYSVTYDTLGFEIPVGHACYGIPTIQI